METEENAREGAAEEEADEGPGCGSPVDKADSLHFELPMSDPEDFLFNICKSLLQIPPEEWEQLQDDFVDTETLAYLSEFCMDLVQMICESLLSIVLPQLYRHMRTCHGDMSTSSVRLSEEQVQTYLGDSIRRALGMALNTEKIHISRRFNQLLVKNTVETVNSVLSLCSQTPIREGVLPVVFVSGMMSSLYELSLLIVDLSVTFKFVLLEDASEKAMAPLSDVFEENIYPVFGTLKEDDLSDFLIEYLTRVVNTLRNSSQIPHRDCESTSGHNNDIYIIIGSNTQILTADEQVTESLPDIVPGSKKMANSEIWPFKSTELSAKQDICQVLNPTDVEGIKTVTDYLLDAVLGEDHQGLDNIQNNKVASKDFKDLTNRLTLQIFGIVMGRCFYQVPLIPAGKFMGDLITFRNSSSNDPGLIVHGLYLKTEEVVARSVEQVLHWVRWCGDNFNSSSTSSSETFYGPEVMPLLMQGGGDHQNPPEEPEGLNDSEENEESYDLLEEPQPGQERSHTSPDMEHSFQTILDTDSNELTETTFLTLLVRDTLVLLGIRDTVQLKPFLMKIMPNLHVNREAKDCFEVTLMGQSLRDFCQGAVKDLLEEYGSVLAVQDAVRLGDSEFEATLKKVIQNQLDKPPERRNRLKTYFDRCKKMCSKRSKSSGIPLEQFSGAQDNSCNASGDQLSPEKVNTEEQLCPCLSRLLAFVRTCWDRSLSREPPSSSQSQVNET